ncbi:DUF3631 domain-containing protein [Candidatus Berkelbacteria bacterium]|nr:DUF3631 domain-containing protein [Candidatus Berkelbacteria bacterium]
MSTALSDLVAQHETFHRDLPSEIREYLHNRGISDEIIENRMIGFCSYNNQKWITLPQRDSSGKYREMVLRKPPGAPASQIRYKVPKGGKACLVNADRLAKEPTTDIVLVEGILDAYAAISAGLLAISSSTGAGTFLDEWITQIPQDRRLIFCFDSDKAGKESMNTHLFRFSQARPDLHLWKIDLPEMGPGKKDLTDFFLSSTAQDRKAALLALAQPYTPPSPTAFLMDQFGDEGYVPILPTQALHGGVGYYALTLLKKGTPTSVMVTSFREMFPCTGEELTRRKFLPIRLPMPDEKSVRWEQKQLFQFLQNEGEVLTLSDAFHYVEDTYRKFIDIPEQRFYAVLSLWTLGTYFYRLFPAYPYLHVTGLKESGKSKTVQIAVLLSFNGEHVTSSSSSASIVRLVDANGAMLGVDEAENLWNGKDQNSKDIQDVLRSGYKVGIWVTKCEADPTTGNHRVIRLDPYSPKILSGIAGLEDALSSRCIEIVMQKTTNKSLANSEVDPSSNDWSDLRAIIYPAALMSFPLIHTAMQEFDLQELYSREAELWRPLLVVARVVDPSLKLFGEILSFALERQAKRKESETDTDAPRILSCIQDLIGSFPEKWLATEELFDALKMEDDFSWLGDEKNKSRRGKWLNEKLKRLGLWDGPGQLRSVDGKKARGYLLKQAALSDACKRFGLTSPPPQESSPVTDPQFPHQHATKTVTVQTDYLLPVPPQKEAIFTNR